MRNPSLGNAKYLALMVRTIIALSSDQTEVTPTSVARIDAGTILYYGTFDDGR